MLKNYFKIVFRNLKRNKSYAFINIGGLAMGLAACLLIGIYIQDELSYDDFHKKSDRIYRVLREFSIPDLQGTFSGTPPSLAPILERSLPEVEEAVRILKRSPVVQHGPQKFVETGFIWVDAGFFDIFSFPILRGKAALNRPGTVVITKAMAAKYFPDKNPIGQTLRVGEQTLEIIGVIANVPSNSSLQFDFIGSLITRQPEPGWGRNYFQTYLLLAKGASKNEIMPQVNKIVWTNTGEMESNSPGNSFIPHLQPLTGIHFGQGVRVEISSASNILYVYLFTALAVFILLLACINFMNLTTARSMERASEVGIRKALGGRRKQLVGQFLGESILMTLGALLMALVLVGLALPILNELADKSLTMTALWGGFQVLALITLTLVVGLLAGSYPAFALSRFESATVLRGALDKAGGRQLRKGLVVFQFAISVALIAGTLIIFNQLSFMRSADLGFNEKNLIVIENAGFLKEQAATFKQVLHQISGVKNVSYIGFDFIETMDIKLAAGRSFKRAFATDSLAVMLNEASLHDYGWTAQQAIGKKITRGGPEYTIVGVMENFHYEPLTNEIYPLLLFVQHSPWQQRFVAARVQADKTAATLEAIQDTWKKFSTLPLRYSFLSNKLAAQYQAEELLAKVFGLFASLAILIACLGLFGLAAYTAERRTKEIGVRKVLGANVTSIVGLLSKDFLKLVLLGFIIAVPIAWYAMNRWLADFAYRIDIGIGIFLIAGGLALLITLATVSWQSIRAALANPVDSLRSE